MEEIKIEDVIISENQRSLDARQVDKISAKIKERGYNTSYPITIDKDNVLVDGGHRVAAAKINGVVELPYVLKPSDVSNIKHAILCNEDGANTRVYDVFDYAELCASLGNSAAQGELGWTAPQVSYYAKIKNELHPDSWDRARGQLTSIAPFVNGDKASLVNDELTIVNWKESHFRAFLKHLPCPHPYDFHTMTAQLNVIEDIYSNPDKLSAKLIGKLATRYGWYMSLEEVVRFTLIWEVDPEERSKLIGSIQAGVFGDKPEDKNMGKLVKAISKLNEKILGVKLYQDDCFQFTPTLEDNSIALVATDIPYNTTDNDWDKIGTDDEYIQWVRSWLNVLRPKLCEDYHLFFCVAPEYMAPIWMLLKEDGWPAKIPIIWEYRNLVKGRDVKDKFIANWQAVFHIGTHNLNWPKDWNEERFAVQQWATPQSNFDDKKLHPTSKPLGLFELFVKIGSKPGDIILDPFAGGGTTGEASKNIGQRQCILVEQQDDYCTVIENRLGIMRNA